MRPPTALKKRATTRRSKAYSTRLVPNALQVTAGRKEAVRRTGKSDVPVLILDDDTTIAGRSDRRLGAGEPG